jgi:hypothetical protein
LQNFKFTLPVLGDAKKSKSTFGFLTGDFIEPLFLDLKLGEGFEAPLERCPGLVVPGGVPVCVLEFVPVCVPEFVMGFVLGFVPGYVPGFVPRYVPGYVLGLVLLVDRELGRAGAWVEAGCRLAVTFSREDPGEVAVP